VHERGRAAVASFLLSLLLLMLQGGEPGCATERGPRVFRHGCKRQEGHMERALRAGSLARSNQAGWGSIWYHKRVELAGHTRVQWQWATCTDTHSGCLDERGSGRGLAHTRSRNGK
jgi:hypothetical protein